MNTPNKLTTIRMILAPVFLFAYLAEFIPHRFIFATVIFAVASITDAIDGKYARKHNQITIYGKLADPVADKMLTTAALLAFMNDGICNIWILMVILTREFAVTSVRLVASAQGVVIPANIWGKVKTATQMIFTVIILILRILSEFSDAVNALPMSIICNSMFAVTAVLAVISGIIYIRNASEVINITM